jgi:hypothetical protein
MTLGHNDLSLVAYGSDGKQIKIVGGGIIANLAGTPDQYTSLAINWDQTKYYAGFSQTISRTTAPILEISIHGDVKVAVTPSEIEQISGGITFVVGLSPTIDGLLYGLFVTDTDQTLVRIDPSQAPGSRLTALYNNEDIRSRLILPEGYELAKWGAPMAAAEDGRLWFLLQLRDGDINKGFGCSLVQLSP